MTDTNKHHRRISSQWIPPSPPIKEMLTFRHRHTDSARKICPNIDSSKQRYELFNYQHFRSNEVSTTKYNALTFIPKNLWEQSRRVANIYFVVVVGLEYIPIFRTVNPTMATLPVIFILVLTAIKDALEDLRRRSLDSRVNNTTCNVWDSGKGRFRKMQWKHIIVGDIVHISNDEFLPADIVLLRSSSDDGNAFMETSNLDGESNLKHRSVPKMFLSHCGEASSVKYESLGANVSCAAPSKDISNITGTIEAKDRREAFGSNNVLLRGCRLKNTTFVEGVVIYSGHDTKLMMNNGRAQYKRTIAERRTNNYIYGCAAILLIIIGISTVCRVIWLSSYPLPNGTTTYPINAPFSIRQDNIDVFASMGTFLLTYQLLIPLSLYITVEIIKLGQVFLMTQDISLYCEEKDEGFTARSLSTGEELGQISHILSDKTGTLTQNKMILRYCATSATSVPVEDNCTIPKDDKHFEPLIMNMLLCNSVFVQTSPRCDAIEAGFYEDGVFTIGNSNFYTYNEEEFEGRVAEFEAAEADGKQQFEGESPDEISLVKGARRFGYYLEGRASGAVHVKINGRHKSLNVLCVIPFDATRKRMSICVEDESDEDVVIIYTKGADSAMFENTVANRNKNREHKTLSVILEESEEGSCESVKAQLENVNQENEEKTISILRKHVDEFSKKGLRTLVYGELRISRSEFDDWFSLFQTVEQSKGDAENDKLQIEVAERLESRISPIGVTAVEDKLQDDVYSCISTLRQAGIQIWVLTGDKKETAEGVANACGLFKKEPIHLEADNLTQDFDGGDVVIGTDLISKLRRQTSHLKNIIMNVANACGLFMDEPIHPEAENLTQDFDGEDVVIGPDLISKLCRQTSHLKKIMLCSSVLCYRLTPAHKAEITKAVKRCGTCVLAIGDGANDVPMIQAANIGIGISGNEGMQASMAADFVIAKFSFLTRLLLLHGYWNYSRLSIVLLYFFYKNAQNVLMTFFIELDNGWSGNAVLNALYSQFYPIVFTSLQPLIFGIYEQDETENELLSSPEKYSVGREGKLYNRRLFGLNILDAIYQGAVCYFFSYAYIVNTVHSIAYFGFVLATTMFISNSAHLLLETKNWNYPVVGIHILCFIFHFGYFTIYTEVVNPLWGMDDTEFNIALYAMSDMFFWATCFITAVVALFPRFLIRILYATGFYLRELSDQN